MPISRKINIFIFLLENSKKIKIVGSKFELLGQLAKNFNILNLNSIFQPQNEIKTQPC